MIATSRRARQSSGSTRRTSIAGHDHVITTEEFLALVKSAGKQR